MGYVEPEFKVQVKELVRSIYPAVLQLFPSSIVPDEPARVI